MMSAVKSKDSKAELLLRAELWSQGYRYRKNWGKVFGHPDLAFPAAKIAVFVDGDFWHGNAWRLRGLSSLAELFPTRTEWWVEKISRNIARDGRVTERLTEEGWLVLRYWESRVLSEPRAVAEEVGFHVSERRRLSAPGSRSHQA